MQLVHHIVYSAKRTRIICISSFFKSKKRKIKNYKTITIEQHPVSIIKIQCTSRSKYWTKTYSIIPDAKMNNTGEKGWWRTCIQQVYKGGVNVEENGKRRKKNAFGIYIKRSTLISISISKRWRRRANRASITA